jgi:hypothetical protein
MPSAVIPQAMYKKAEPEKPPVEVGPQDKI